MLTWRTFTCGTILAFASCRDFDGDPTSSPGGSDAGSMPGGGSPIETAGLAGMALAAGEAGGGGAAFQEPVEGGSAGTPGESLGGVAGDGAAPPEVGGNDFGHAGSPVSLEPFCRTGPQGHPAIGVTFGTDLTIALTYSATPFVVFMPQPTTEIVALTWKYGDQFVPWSCFDAVPRPQRVAAGNGPDVMVQAYATTADGRLFARQQTDVSNYGKWFEISLPNSEALAADVATVEGAPGSLYVATNAGIFARHRLANELEIGDPSWHSAATTGSRRIAVGVLEGGQHDMLVLTSQGALLESVQSSAGEQYDFDASDVVDDGQAFVDADFGRNSLGQLQTYGVLETGALVVRTRVSGAWEKWRTVEGTPRLKSIAVGTLSSRMPFLFGIGDYGLPYYSADGGATWSTLL